MSRRKRSPEEQARREKIRELLQINGVSSMEDIQNLFKETIAEFMENGLDADATEFYAICITASILRRFRRRPFRRFP